jgi:hypothetical protein
VTSWVSRRKWVDNIKMDLKEIRCEGMECIEMISAAPVNMAMNLRVP